tara:strand:+ start:3025 stop:3924 length:900 start_codon:yes stop_codon:yes gene_type:complete
MSFKIASEVGLLGESQLANVPFKGPNAGFDSSVQADAGTKIEFIPIHFKNVPVISFIAYMDDIKDTINQAVQSTQPYGRPDPIRVWKSADRKIALSIKILSSSREMALRNLNNLNWLLASSYPTYDSSFCGCATSIAASPLFRVKYANLITNVSNHNGLLCVIPSFSVTHEFKSGVIHVRRSDMSAPPKGERTGASLLRSAGFSTQAENYIVATKIGLSCTLEVVHEHSLGWDLATGEWRGGKASGYPYGLGLTKDTSDPPSSSGAGGSTAQGHSDRSLQSASNTHSRETGAAVDKHMG